MEVAWAIAVNPKDERFKDFVGKVVTIPIVGRKIKIIEDDYADPEQGTGALKITPAHDFNDYDVGQRNNLEIINIFTEAGKINENAPKEYIGLDRFEARKRILKELKEKEFFVKEENIKNKVPYGDRSNSIIERTIALAQEIMVKVGIITSSPSFISKAATAISRAHEPLVTATACCLPTNLAILVSKDLTNGPSDEIQPVSIHLFKYSFSLPSRTGSLTGMKDPVICFDLLLVLPFLQI
mgnify:CR=1 FL=1